MSFETISALALFAFVSSVTPGPNNVMLMASGANFGLRRTVPHMLGISQGLVFMYLIVSVGIAPIFEVYPLSHSILQAVSTVYLLWLAWKIAWAAPVSAQDTAGQPLTYLQAAMFQWVNPKAWAMVLTTISVYTPEQSAQVVLFVAITFTAVNLPSIGTWVILGQQMARFLTDSRRLVAFNWTMAGLLVLSLFPLLLTN